VEGFQMSHGCPLVQVHKNGHAILCALTFALAEDENGCVQSYRLLHPANVKR
jgi:DNA-directed RNA polymerase subunit L